MNNLRSTKTVILALLIVTSSATNAEKTTLSVSFEIRERNYELNMMPDELQVAEDKSERVIIDILNKQRGYFNFIAHSNNSNEPALRFWIDSVDPNNTASILQNVNLYAQWNEGATASWRFYSSQDSWDIEHTEQELLDKITEVLQPDKFTPLTETVLHKIPVTSGGEFRRSQAGTNPGWLLTETHRELCLAQDSKLKIESEWTASDITRNIDVIVLKIGDYNRRVFSEIIDAHNVSQQFNIDFESISTPSMTAAYVTQYSPLPDGDCAQSISPSMLIGGIQ